MNKIPNEVSYAKMLPRFLCRPTTRPKIWQGTFSVRIALSRILTLNWNVERHRYWKKCTFLYFASFGSLVNIDIIIVTRSQKKSRKLSLTLFLAFASGSRQRFIQRLLQCRPVITSMHNPFTCLALNPINLSLMAKTGNLSKDSWITAN